MFLNYKFWLRSSLVMLLAGSPAYAAGISLPNPIRNLLSQIKGEWIVYEKDLDNLVTKLNLQADGQGTLVNYAGRASINWQLNAGRIKITLPNGPLTLGTGSTTTLDENGNEQVYESIDSLESLEFKFKKVEGLNSILWEMTEHTITQYPSNPEKPSETNSLQTKNVKLIANRQLKNFVPSEGQMLSLTLPSYKKVGEDNADFVAVLGRLDAGNVFTLVDGDKLGQDSLYWTIDQGTLRISNGHGYTIRLRRFEDQSIGAHLYSELSFDATEQVFDNMTVYADQAKREQGFTLDSQFLTSCWSSLGADYCFTPDRQFSLNSKNEQGVPSSWNGLWSLVDKKVVVKRYRDASGQWIQDLPSMLACEEQLKLSLEDETSCRVGQSRSYELLNQDAKHIAVYRTLTFSSDYVMRLFHVLTKKD